MNTFLQKAAKCCPAIRHVLDVLVGLKPEIGEIDKNGKMFVLKTNNEENRYLYPQNLIKESCEDANLEDKGLCLAVDVSKLNYLLDLKNNGKMKPYVPLCYFQDFLKTFSFGFIVTDKSNDADFVEIEERGKDGQTLYAKKCFLSFAEKHLVGTNDLGFYETFLAKLNTFVGFQCNMLDLTYSKERHQRFRFLNKEYELKNGLIRVVIPSESKPKNAQVSSSKISVKKKFPRSFGDQIERAAEEYQKREKALIKFGEHMCEVVDILKLHPYISMGNLLHFLTSEQKRSLYLKLKESEGEETSKVLPTLNVASLSRKQESDNEERKKSAIPSSDKEVVSVSKNSDSKSESNKKLPADDTPSYASVLTNLPKPKPKRMTTSWGDVDSSSDEEDYE